MQLKWEGMLMCHYELNASKSLCVKLTSPPPRKKMDLTFCWCLTFCHKEFTKASHCLFHLCFSSQDELMLMSAVKNTYKQHHLVSWFISVSNVYGQIRFFERRVKRDCWFCWMKKGKINKGTITQKISAFELVHPLQTEYTFTFLA